MDSLRNYLVLLYQFALVFYKDKKFNLCLFSFVVKYCIFNKQKKKPINHIKQSEFNVVAILEKKPFIEI